MNGQLSIFDLNNDNNERKPCDYRFKRYIGQKVRFWRENEEGTITDIFPYYTYVKTSEGIKVGTPTTIAPL